MRSLWALLVFGGCSSLYIEPSHHDQTNPPDAGPAPNDAQTCPVTGTHAEITYPLDGATNVPTPVPIATHVFIPNTWDGKGMYLSDAAGHMLDLTLYDPNCSSSLPVQPPDDSYWTECYDLPPDSTFTWHIWITCYDASGPHEIATSTFRTAP